MPALPLDEAGRYVAGAYVVFVALIGIYVSIMAIRLAHMQRDLAELHELADRALGRAGAQPAPPGRPDQPGPHGETIGVPQ